MREIKFRGKSKESNEWVYGYYVAECGSHGILIDTTKVDGCTRRLWVEVDPDTVGQFTGKLALHNVEIYEDDIFGNNLNKLCIVRYDEETAKFVADGGCVYIRPDNWCNYEVVGNVHDNHKLLGVAK